MLNIKKAENRVQTNIPKFKYTLRIIKKRRRKEHFVKAENGNQENVHQWFRFRFLFI